MICRVPNDQLPGLLCSTLTLSHTLILRRLFILPSACLTLSWHCGLAYVVPWAWNPLLSHLCRLSFEGDLSNHIVHSLPFSLGGNGLLYLEFSLLLAFLLAFWFLSHPPLCVSFSRCHSSHFVELQVTLIIRLCSPSCQKTLWMFKTLIFQHLNRNLHF